MESQHTFRTNEWAEYYNQFTYFTPDTVRDECWPMIMEHSSSVKKGVVLVHGLTDSPYFMRAISVYFYERLGYNVYMPLLHMHGLKEPDNMRGVSLNEWKANVRYAVDVAASRCSFVSIGGLSTGGVLSYYTLNTNKKVNGSLFLFSAALDLAGGPFGIVGELKERIMRFYIPELLNEKNPLIGENPYRYCRMDLDGAHELALLINETDRITSKYNKKNLLNRRIFAAHSESDTTADIAGIEQLQEVAVPGKFNFYRIPERFNVSHASVVLKDPVVVGNKILEKENPQFDDMMAAIAAFE